jgi:hypothetical protein
MKALDISASDMSDVIWAVSVLENNSSQIVSCLMGDASDVAWTAPVPLWNTSDVVQRHVQCGIGR